MRFLFLTPQLPVTTEQADFVAEAVFARRTN